LAANLVVVESRAKATTIEKYLGRNYTVRACMGHVRDLPSSRLGVDVDHDFQPQYVIPKDRKDIVKRLKEDARGKTTVLLATDPDREGEAIAWHLISALGLDGDQEIRRIEFHEITKSAIQEAMKNPREIDIARVDAQQARRILDRLIGYPVSNFLGRGEARLVCRAAFSRSRCAWSWTANARSWPSSPLSTGLSKRCSSVRKRKPRPSPPPWSSVAARSSRCIPASRPAPCRRTCKAPAGALPA
jgi:DNA topoisomerase IA